MARLAGVPVALHHLSVGVLPTTGPYPRALEEHVPLAKHSQTKPGLEEAILPIGNLEDLLSTNPYVCMFNDQRWRIAEG